MNIGSSVSTVLRTFPRALGSEPVVLVRGTELVFEPVLVDEPDCSDFATF